MVFFLAALLAITCYGMTLYGTGEFNKAYLDKRNTTAINGIFVILIVFSHYSQYAGFGGVFDAPYIYIKNHLHQMVVATFLFYSGYGMMEQIKKRGTAYVSGIPKRAGKLLFRFDVAVLMFLVMNTLLGAHYAPRRILLSLIGWKALGNSNWYIFDILALYVLMFAAFSIGERLSVSRRLRHEHLPGLVLLFILTLAFVYVMMKTDKPTRWFNTVILFPVGSFYSVFKEDIERLIMRNDVTYYLTLLIMVPVYIFTYLHRRSYGIEGYTLWALAFIAVVILVTMKVGVYNKILEWFGKHVFSIYILQRIPMILLDHYGFIDAHKYLGLIVAFALTIPLALAFEKATDAVLTVDHKSK